MTVPRTPRRALIFACAWLAAVLVRSPAHAQDDPMSCKDPQTQTELTFCAGRDADAADARMQAAYARVHAAQPAPAAALLDSAQAAWTAFRMRECDYQSTAFEGGSAQPMVDNVCSGALARQRTDDFAHPAPALSATCSRAAAPARCAGAELSAADSALNAAYRALRTATMKEDSKLDYPRDYDPSIRTRSELLRATERAWIRWRDAQCAWEAAAPNAAPAARTGCLRRMSHTRAAQLREAIRGDL